MKETVLKLLGWAEFRARMKHRFNPGPVDTSQFADHVASKIPWSPMDTRSVLLRRRLAPVGPLALTFALPPSLKILLTLLPVLITLPMILVVDTWSTIAFITPFILVPSYLTIGYILYRSASRPVFDRKSGTFWKGPSQSRHKVAVALADIHALQLISYFYSDGELKSAGVVYQLNVVVSDKSRREVFTQRQPLTSAGRTALMDDCERLARWLGVHLWNAIHEFDR
ncbi:hypothetical protein ABWH88_09550 [Marinobacter adhaerens]|jgi:hypothetical protein|uniref:Uncharacterized protein n=2 Tax=Marinobacter adhaerens TaxID=1033846 RepID=A0ABX8IMD1_9GAMM|nr:hypothetical protein [Marinobacter adhaerens]ADP95919.1 conserved hypothetical protein, membrane [Marinobacter adhaerens HP15]MBW4979920.1 hypothetical protein [Marinobacter adhaerens]QWV13953.1 hypothetical protein KQ249_04880 [Marinobacter adhaerens]